MDLAKRAAVFRVAVRRLGTRGVGRRYPEEELKRATRSSMSARERRRRERGEGARNP
jgi:hypothetical protein